MNTLPSSHLPPANYSAQQTSRNESTPSGTNDTHAPTSGSSLSSSKFATKASKVVPKFIKQNIAERAASEAVQKAVPNALQQYQQAQQHKREIRRVLSLDLSTINDAQDVAPGGFYNFTRIQSKQDIPMAARIMHAAEIQVPQHLVGTATFRNYIGNPMDMRLFINPDDTSGSTRSFAKLEDNTFNWGGPLAGPYNAVEKMRSRLIEFGAGLLRQTPSPLVLMGCSGRAERVDPNDPNSKLKDNGIVGEKLWQSDKIRQGWLDEGEDKGLDTTDIDIRSYNPLTFQAKSKEINFANNGKPTVLNGYTEQLVQACKEGQLKLEKGDGGDILTFHGRQINAIMGERTAASIRGALSLEALPASVNVGPMIDIGTDKSTAYQAHNDFVAKPGVTDKYPLCARPTRFTICENEQEIVDAIGQLQADGKRAIIKPQNTGWGHGIRTFLDPSESEVAIRGKITDSIAQVDEHYNKQEKVAGFPYTVAEYLDGVKATALSGNLEGQPVELEFRMGCLSVPTPEGGLKITAVPFIAKVQPQGSAVANTSSQMDGKLTLDDLQLPGCNADTMAMASLTEKDLTQLSTFCAEYITDVLTKMAEKELEQSRLS